MTGREMGHELMGDADAELVVCSRKDGTALGRVGVVMN